MKYSETLIVAFLTHATSTVAQEWFFIDDGPQIQFEIRSFDDGSNYDTRSLFEDDGGYYNPHTLEARDYYDGYSDLQTLQARDYSGSDQYDQSLAIRSFESDDYNYPPLESRAVFLIQADHSPHDPFHQMLSSLLQPAQPSPMESLMNLLSSPAHHDHSHLLFNPMGHSSILLSPQRPQDPFDDLFNSIADHHHSDSGFGPDMDYDFDHGFDHGFDHDHKGAFASAHVSSSGSGTSCISSTMIGPEGIPHTTKECTTTHNGQPVSHMRTTNKVDSGNRVFNGLFGDHPGQKVLRNKRILELDAPDQRGEIHTFHKDVTPDSFGSDFGSDFGFGGDDGHHDHESHTANVEKHDLRDEAHDLHTREAEAEPEPEAVADADAEVDYEDLEEEMLHVRDAEAEAEAEAEVDAE